VQGYRHVAPPRHEGFCAVTVCVLFTGEYLRHVTGGYEFGLESLGDVLRELGFRAKFDAVAA
jgi:hypothetical protein